MEFQKFMNTLENKSANTKKSYERNYKKLHGYLNADITDVSNEKIIEACELVDNSNTRAGLLNIGILIKKMDDKDYKSLEKFRETNRQLIQEHLQEKNNTIAHSLPGVNDLLDYTQRLFDAKEYRKYIINYLLCNYFVRNEDLDLSIVSKQSEIDDKNNFLLIKQRPTRVTYIRNRYKTHHRYGRKEYTIEDKQFYKACNKIGSGEMLCNTQCPAWFVKKATLSDIGESNYCKIFIDAIRETGQLNQLNAISDRRGTSVGVLINSYNLHVGEDNDAF